MFQAPPAQAALALNDGPLVPSAVARLAETVDDIIRGTTVGATLRAPPGFAHDCSTSRWAATSPVPLPATTARSRRSRPDC